jgi:heat shock protein 1/8
MTKFAIGIDLGTTYSCVGVVKNGNVEIIANDQGNRTTPSYVAFTDTERLVGEAAKNQSAMNPVNTIFDSKRLIGRKFNEQTVQSDIKLFTFPVINDNDKPVISVSYKNETKKFKPEEISAMILSKMKETAEKYIGDTVDDAVITVPAYFNDAQRQATKDAGAIAGLNVLRIINEPTASAIAYGLDNKDNSEKHVLIFDCGGGTHDVSLLLIDGGVFEVLATAGDSHLGGSDIDQRMVEYFATEFKKKHKLDLTTNPRSVKRLMNECEKAKRTLSSSTVANLEIDSLFEGIDFNTTITRARFNDICSDIFKRTMTPVEKVLKDSDIPKNKIDEIVLVGGSTRIPKIQELLSEYFNGKELCKSVNPDEAVAQGAAIQAAILTGNSKDLKTDILLIDVTPLSLGIETSGNVMTNIIDRNSTIPCSKTKTFSTYSDNQEVVTIRIFEGERPMTKDNNLLGQFNMEGIPRKPRGEPQIEVSLDLDANGILSVTALEKSSSISKNIKITNENGRLTKEQIDKMIADAEKFKEDDKILKENIESKNSFESNLYSLKDTLNKDETKDKVSDTDKNTLQELEKWFSQKDLYSKDEYDSKIKEIQSLLVSLMSKSQPSTDTSTHSSSEPKVEDID